MKNTMIHNLVKHLPGLKHIKSEFYRGFVLLSILLTLGVGEMWGKLILVDMGSAPNWYDNAHIHYYSGSDKYVALTSTGITNIYQATIPDSHGDGWRLCRYVSGTRYNDGNWISDNSADNKKFTYGGSSASTIVGLVTGGYIYFDNSATQWTGNIQFVIGRGTSSGYSRTYEMTQISNTKIWYVNLTDKDNHQWWDATYYGFIASASKFGDGGWGSNNLSKATKYSAAYTSAYSLNDGSTYWCVPSGTTNGSSFTITYKTGYDNIPKLTASSKVYTRTKTGSTYTLITSGSWPTTISIQGTVLNGNGTSNRTTASTSTGASGSYNAVSSGLITMSYTSSDNWYFEGWTKAASTAANTSTTSTCEYNITAATTAYAYFTQKHTVTFGIGGTSGSSTVSATAGGNSISTGAKIKGGTQIVVTAAPATGYEIIGWYSNSACTSAYTSGSGGVTISGDKTTFTLAGANFSAAKTIYVKIMPKTHTVTLSYSGEAHYGSAGGGVLSSVTATYNANMPSMGTAPTADNGYRFYGYFTGHNGTGTQYYNADGTSAKKWDVDDDATLYAYFKVGTISDITLNAAVWAPVDAGAAATYITADPILDPDPVGTKKICWELLYDNDNPVPGDHPAIAVSGNKVKFAINGLAPGNYHIRAVLHEGSDCSGDVLDTYDKTFTIATHFNVTVKYMCGTEEIQASITQEAEATDWTSISAPTIFGYTFSTWDLGDGGITKHGSDALTKQTGFRFKASYNGTLTAVYTKRKLIFLDISQTFGTGKWSNPYVYLYKSTGYWDDTNGAGATGDACVAKGAMLAVDGASGLYYYDYTNVSNFGNVVAFTWGNHTSDLHFPANNDAIYRGDFSEGTPLFIPAVGQNADDHTAHYFNRGYWVNYVGPQTGYTLYVYNSSDELIKKIKFTSADKRMTMKATTDLEAKTTYKVEVYRDNDHYYKNNTARDNSNCQSNWKYTEDVAKGTMITTAAGDYTFTLSYTDFSNDKDFQIRMKIDYPAAVNDFQVMYYDNAKWSGTTTHASTWRHPSRIIKARSGGVDTISFFVAKGNTPRLYAHKVSSINASTGAITWASLNVASAAYQSLSVDSSAVWNFKVTQSSAGVISSIVNIGAYTGEYYIRCDAMNSKWDNYTTDHDHRMTYSSFSESDENAFGEKFSHYKAKWCRFGKNVKFVIANDYSPCISDTLIQDNGNPYNNINSDGFLKDDGNPEETQNIYSANIRFMWNRKTNKISRAYVASSTNPERLFLVLRGNYAIKGLDGETINDDGTGPSVILLDDQNWIYEEILYIKPGTRFKLYACYAQASANPNGAQYFRGAYDSNRFTTDANSVILIDGSGDYQKVRVLYDFKTNRLICAWLPDGNVSGDLHINSDVMIIREHQEPASYLSFANASSQLSGVKTVYGVMKFNRWVLNNRKQTGTHQPLDVGDQKSIYERSLYFISFPFDVRVSDIFGFGRYWDEWYLEYYDGLTRAKNGFWIDSPPNWKYISPSEATNYVLKANVGYILGLDLDYMAYDNEEFWAHDIETIELFFPSTASLETLKQTTCTIPELGDEYLCTINRTGIDGDRRVKDSYWRCIGVPSLNLYNTAVKDDGGNTITWKTDYTWYEDKREFPFIYMWNKGDNTLTPQATSTFTFLPMHSYLVQNGKKIIWTNVSAKSSIVARRAKEEDYTEYNWRLALMSDTTLVDQTYVRMSELEQVTDSFDFGQDLSKDFNANRSDLYTISNDARLAANSMPLKTETTTIVPVGVRIKKEGEFTLAMPDGTYGVSITLVDNYNGTRTELGAGFTYTFESEVGLFDDRFHLEIAKVKSVATGVEVINGENGENGIRKVMIDGILYLIRGNRIYDARGVRVE